MATSHLYKAIHLLILSLVSSILVHSFVLGTLSLALAGLLEPDPCILGCVRDRKAGPMLVLHTVAEVFIKLRDLCVPVLEELIPFDQQ